jgi:hypothetical protein
MSTVDERLVGLSVADCPHCHHHHQYAVLVVAAARPTLVFGGGGNKVEVALRCPKTDGMLATELELANNEEFVRVVDPGAGGAALAGRVGGPPEARVGDADAAAAWAASPESADYAEWVRASRGVALDFAKTMLTAASAAIPVYFAVLKYLGAEKVTESGASGLSVLPPVAFLVAVAIFATALRPRLAAMTATEFAEFRGERLRRLDRYVGAGLITFVVAVLLALIAFAVVLVA